MPFSLAVTPHHGITSIPNISVARTSLAGAYDKITTGKYIDLTGLMLVATPRTPALFGARTSVSGEMP
jgi:hypothetical protein